MTDLINIAIYSTGTVIPFIISRFLRKRDCYKYVNHTKVTSTEPRKLSKKDIELITKWHRHVNFNVLEPNEPEQPGLIGYNSWLLDLLVFDSKLPWVRPRKERWLVTEDSATRESDGEQSSIGMHKRFLGIIAVANATSIEIDNILNENPSNRLT